MRDGLVITFHASAYLATSGSVRFGPSPPTRIFGRGDETGRGLLRGYAAWTRCPSNGRVSPDQVRRARASVSSSSAYRSRSSGNAIPSASASPLNHAAPTRSEEHTSELQSRQYLVCRLLLEKKK